MPDGKSEPSMEEIIASISRLIAEDKRPAERRGGAAAPGERVAPVATDTSDILDLIQMVNEDGSVSQVAPWAEGATATLAATDTPAAAAPAENGTGRLEPEPLRAEAAVEPRRDTGRERIVSTATSGAAAAAFARLGALPREPRAEPETPLGGGERTLEEIVRDMLRPLLQAWLDSNLPGIVEKLVREEIARVVGDAGLR